MGTYVYALTNRTKKTIIKGEEVTVHLLKFASRLNAWASEGWAKGKRQERIEDRAGEATLNATHVYLGDRFGEGPIFKLTERFWDGIYIDGDEHPGQLVGYFAEDKIIKKIWDYFAGRCPHNPWEDLRVTEAYMYGEGWVRQTNDAPINRSLLKTLKGEGYEMISINGVDWSWGELGL